MSQAIRNILRDDYMEDLMYRLTDLLVELTVISHKQRLSGLTLPVNVRGTHGVATLRSNFDKSTFTIKRKKTKPQKLKP
jgi:hypothetical protein